MLFIDQEWFKVGQMQCYLLFKSDLKLAKIDCENEQELCQRYHVSKYPTLKVFRNGEVGRVIIMSSEYHQDGGRVTKLIYIII